MSLLLALLLAPPAPIACLERHYGATAVEKDGAHFARLPDGTLLPLDDGRKKSFDDKLDAPDVEDVFSIPYRPGPIRPVTTPDDDPGRIRIPRLFEVAYPPGGLVRIDFLGQKLTVHRKVAPAFARVAARLGRALRADPGLGPFLEHLGGTYNPRKIAGTDRPSAHSYGISIDINVARSHYWRSRARGTPILWRNQIPQAIVDAFEAEGFIWGGRWYHYDTMHFEYRPELLDPACLPHARPVP